MAEVTITKNNFQEEVVNSNIPVLVDFLGRMVWSMQNGITYN